MRSRPRDFDTYDYNRDSFVVNVEDHIHAIVRGTKLITIESQGGLGNQLFQASLAIELSRIHLVDVQIDPWRHRIVGARPFELPYQLLGVSVSESNPRFATVGGPVGKAARMTCDRLNHRIIREVGHEYDACFLTPRNRARFVGYFQSWKYSENSIDFLRTSIRNYQPQSRWLNSRLTDLNKNGPWFALHIRRGDYLSAQSQRAHGLLPLEYYASALSKMSTALPEARPVVFSDDPESAREMADSLNSNMEIFDPIAGGSNLENLIIMSNASGIITANSSYSWWAARLGESEGRPVFAPSTWYPRPIGTPTDLIPTGWNVI